METENRTENTPDDEVTTENAREDRQDSRQARAFTLYCQGMRVEAIAQTLSVSMTTIRRWVRARMETLAQEERAERAEQLQRAIESQRAIASAAWHDYERERTAEEPDHHEGARFLSIALAAQREIARMQGLYYRIGRDPKPVHINVTRGPDGDAASKQSSEADTGVDDDEQNDPLP